jgi:hypothetical protein
MKGLKNLIGVLGLCVTTPIWLFLVYTMLCAIHPDRLVWFLFWIYTVAKALQFVAACVVEVCEKK